MQFRSTYPTYPSAVSLDSILRSVRLKSRLGSLQNMAVPISPVGGPTSPGKSFLCSKLMLTGVTNFFPVEESAYGDFNAVDAALELENLDLVGEGFLVGL